MSGGRILEFEGFRLDLAQRLLTGPDGSAIDLKPRVFDTLVALAGRSGEVVSKDALMKAIWPGVTVEENNLNQAVSALRKALADGEGRRLVVTVPGRGYQFTADVRRETPGWRAITSESPSETSGKDALGQAPSLAVLPFVNRSDNASDEVFADGMVEDVIAALSQYPHLRLLSSMATAHLRPSGPIDPGAVGAQLGATYLMEGNVRRTEAGLRVSARLVETATAAVLWSGQFERPISELARLQEELVVDLAGALNMQIHTAEMQRALKKPGDITAWEAVNRAMAAQRQIDPASLVRGLEEAKRAVSLAPDYPLAHGMLAVASGTMYLIASPDDPQEVQRIRAIAGQALALGQDIPFVLVNAAGALLAVGLADEAMPPLQEALKRAPQLGPAHFVSGQACCLLNQPEKALAHLEMASRLVPAPYMQVYIKDWQSNAMIRMGRWAEAEALADEVRTISPQYFPAHMSKAAILLLHQRRDEARAVLAPMRSAKDFQLDMALRLYARCFAKANARDEMLAAIRTLWNEMAAELDDGVSFG